jgi:hypothetical protein
MKQMITLAMGGPGPEALQVEADVLGGLAVHHPGGNGAGWRISHVKSGLALGPWFYLKRTAVQLRERLLALGNWDLDQDELNKWLIEGGDVMDSMAGTRYEKVRAIIDEVRTEELRR